VLSLGIPRLRGALCYGADPEIFWEPLDVDTARAYCARCPVVVRCRDYAVGRSDSDDDDAVWGGTTRDERRALRDTGSRPTCPGCGSTERLSDGYGVSCLNCGLAWPT
jgi:WhiB family redox-sensing transcriptional regulator